MYIINGLYSQPSGIYILFICIILICLHGLELQKTSNPLKILNELIIVLLGKQWVKEDKLLNTFMRSFEKISLKGQRIFRDLMIYKNSKHMYYSF